MRRATLAWMVAAAAVLSACGGSGDDETTSLPADDTQSIDLSGAAAKGLIANGTISVHEVSGGSLSASPLGSTVTDSSGRFSLRLTLPRGKPFVVKVSGGSNTTHLDEITGTAQSLPANFEMRAALAPASGGALSVSVTPFSEMAVAAAEKADGGLTADNIASGNATVAQLLGFQPTTVTIKSTSSASTLEEQKLALMLAAVSQMAASGSAGCGSGTPGERAACVVDKLADSTSVGTLRLETGGADLGAALGSAINTVLQNPSIAGNVSQAVVATIVENLGCTGTSCTPNTTPPGKTVADAIAAAKSLFGELKSDWTTLFVSGSTAGVGDAKAEATKFGAAMKGVQAPVELLVKDTGAMALGIDLFNDYKAGRTAVNGRFRGAGMFATEASYHPMSERGAAACTVYQDSAFSKPATSPANAATVACTAVYYYNYFTNTEYSHLVTLVPTDANGNFSYGTRARQVQRSTNVRTYLDSGFRSGTVAITLNSAGQVVAMSVNGELAGAFESGGTALVSHHHSISLNGTRAIDVSSGTTTTSLSGSIAVKDAADATLGTLQVRSAWLRDVVTGNTGGQLTEGELDLAWATPTARFAGLLSATEPAWSKDHTQYLPTRVVLEGTLTNIDGTTETDFLSGRLTLVANNFGSYSPSQPTSASNFVTVDASFRASVTAQGRPQLQVIAGTSHNSSEDRPAAATLQYRSLVSGTPRMTIDIGVRADSEGVPTYSLNEPVQGLFLSVRKGAPVADLVWNGSTVIGTVNTSSGVLTFSDGTFMSVELAH